MKNIEHKINQNNPATWLKPGELLMCGKFDVAWMYVIFGDIEGYEDYCVSSYGFVWKSAESGWKMISHTPRPDGYISLSLRKNGESKSFLIHRIVLSNLYMKPFGGKFVCEGRHLNGDKSNNQLYNLNWCTPKVNQADRARHGTSNRGERQWQSILIESQVIEIVDRYKKGEKSIDLAKEFGVNQLTVNSILDGRSWVHVTGIAGSIARRTRTGLNSKLSKDDVLNIVDMKKNGYKTREISEKYGVAMQNIQKILNGEVWFGVTGIIQKRRNNGNS